MELESLLYLFIVSTCVVLQCITSSPVTFLRESRATYLAARQSFLDAEERMMIGENLTLSVKEETANKILLNRKHFNTLSVECLSTKTGYANFCKH
jgi:hypothetical protein